MFDKPKFERFRTLTLKLYTLVAGREVGAQKASTVRLLYIYIYIERDMHIKMYASVRHKMHDTCNLAGLAEPTGKDKGNTR